MLTDSQMAHWRARGRFTLWFVLGCSAAALLLNGLYGISKNQATPSWCFWSCAITAALWYLFYLVADVRPVAFVSGPLAAAGRNVLLAYLISEMLPGLLEALGLGRAYDHLASSCLTAVARSAACGVVILAVATGLNRLGLRLRL
jgi:predicted acyltransferase